MLNNNEILPQLEETPKDILDTPRKPYQKPELEDLGDLRTLTLGGTPGGGDSGSPGTQNFPI